MRYLNSHIIAAIAVLCSLQPFSRATAQFCEPGDPHPLPDNSDWLWTTYNAIQYQNRISMQQLSKKLQNAQNQKVQFLYFGDQPAESSVFSATVRAELQSHFGYGGLGLIRPYCASRFYKQQPFSCSLTGNWTYSNSAEPATGLSVGLTGYTVQTSDSAATLSFGLDSLTISEYSRVRVMLKRSKASFDFVITSGSESQVIDVYKSGTETSELILDFKKGIENLNIRLFRKDNGQKEFELYGISVENPYNGGIIWHEVSNERLSFNQLTSLPLFKSQIAQLKPDAVVFDIGVWDFWRNELDSAKVANQISSIITAISKSNPGTAIIFISPQSIYRGSSNLRGCEDFSNLLSGTLMKSDALVYDWYWIARGRNSMPEWRKRNLASTDFFHLNAEGLQLKAAMFVNAMHQSCDYLTSGNNVESLRFNLDSLRAVSWDTQSRDSAANLIWVFHKVRKGQTIWTIASQFKVSAADIRTWNSLKSNYIWAGQVLKIQTRAVPGRDEVAGLPKTPVKPKTPTATGVRYHKVKSGETLSSIARKYRTTVSEIKRLNRLKSNTIRIGQVLRIK